MNEKINYREKVPCFGNEPAADIELLKKTSEDDRKLKALLEDLDEDCSRVESMIFNMCVSAISASSIAIGYFLCLIIQQITK